MPTPVALSWSGGKDAAMALGDLRRSPDYEVVELLTTVGEATDRVTMHGVRRELVAAQAAALGLEVTVVPLPPDPGNDEYERRMADATAALADRGVERMAFADLFLDDVRAYREQRLADAPLDGLWPLWDRDTADLAREFVDRGYRAVLVAVDGDRLGESFAGRAYDEALLADLPEDVDPCGEHGAFHTFVRDGPGFDRPVAVERGRVEAREVGDGTYYYRDLEAATGDEPQ